MDMDPATQQQRQEQAPRTGLSWPWCTGLLCHSNTPRPQGYDQAGWCGWWCDCCHTIYAYTETRQLSCWNSDALKYNYWEMCDCRLVSVYVRSHTYSQWVCMYSMCVCECVYCFVYSHRNVTSQSGSLSLSIMFGVLLLPVDAITRPCPALPCPARPCSTFSSPAAHTCTSVTFAT